MRSFHPTFITSNKILINKTNRDREFGDRMWRNQLFIDLVLHININLFAVQQSIDHIPTSIVWTQNQCGLSTLHFFTISEILMKKQFTHLKKIGKTNWRWNMMQSAFHLTLSCTLTSICLQSNSRLITSKYPSVEAKISVVCPSYHFLPSHNFNKKIH